MPPSPVFTRIDSVVLRVHDHAAAVEWYRSRLGFQVLYEDLAARIAILHMGRGETLALWELRQDEVAAVDEIAGTFPVFESTNVDEQRAELIARGIATSEIRTMPRIRCFSFWDLDGNRLEACEVIEAGDPGPCSLARARVNRRPS